LEQASQRFAKRVGPEVARIFLLAVHGEERAAEARGGDAHWQVGDANWVIWEGRKCVDTETGNTVYVSGERVVITNPEGQIVTQFKNPKVNTRAQIQSGRWVPVNE
jgi:hypothetical protein